jgi:hypothetical protein
MIRPLLLCALLVLCASACSVAGTAGTPRATERASMVQNSPEAAYASPIAPRASNTPNEAGTLAVMALNATEKARSEAREMLDRTATMQVKNDAYVAGTQTAQSPGQTATVKAQGTQNALSAVQWTREAARETATYAAPRDEATAVYLRESAKWAPISAVVDWLAMLLGGLGVFAIGGALAYVVLTRPHVAPTVEPVEEESTDDTFGLGPDLLPIPDVPEPCPLTGDMLMHYIDYAMSNAPLGVQNAGAALTGVVDRGSCWAMVNWLDGRKYTTIERVKETNSNYSKKVLNENGRQWCKDEREKYATPTLLPESA